MPQPLPVWRRFFRFAYWPLQRLHGSARHAPATLVFLAALWILGAATGSLRHGPEAPLLDWVAVSAQSLTSHPAALVLCSFFANGIAGYIAGTVLALAVGLPCERLLGTRRFLAVGTAGQITGALLTVGFAALTSAVIGDWSRALVSESYVGPLAFLVAVVAASSAKMSTLWRRRLRLLMFTLLILLALYGGSFSDLMVLGSAAAGAFAGPFLAGRRPERPHSLVTSRRESRVLVALAVAASALGPVLSALTNDAVGPLSVLRYLFTSVEVTDPGELADLCNGTGQTGDCAAARLQLRAGLAGFFLATLPQVLLVVFSEGLRRGRRFAWLGALLLQGVMTVLAAVRIVRFLSGEERGLLAPGAGTVIALVLPMVVPLAVFVLLACTAKLFPVSAPPGTYRRLFLQAATAAVLLAGIYLAAGMLNRGGFSPSATAGLLVADLPDRFLPILEVSSRAPGIVPQNTAAVLVYEGVGVLFWVLVSLLLLRSFLAPPYSLRTRDENRARELLKTHGGSTMAWMTLWEGNRYWFSPSGNSYIAYRLDLGVALTVGEPVGPRDEVPEVIEGFTAFCTANGTTACFYSVGAEVREYTERLGFSALRVAEETVLPLGRVAFKGKRFQDIRTAMNHAKRQGIQARWINYRTAPLAVLDQLHAISEEWVADKKMPEMGFTLGGLEEVDDPDVRCLVAIDEEGTVHAVTSWLPVFRNGRIEGWTLDFMRRRGSGFRLGMDFLIASAAISLQDEGCSFLSLSGAPLAQADVQPAASDGGSPAAGARVAAGPAGTAPVMDRVLDFLGATLEPVYGFRSLLAFKAKFDPDYVPLFMTYPDPAALPVIGNALARAYLPKVTLVQGLSLARRIVDRTP